MSSSVTLPTDSMGMSQIVDLSCSRLIQLILRTSSLVEHAGEDTGTKNYPVRIKIKGWLVLTRRWSVIETR